MLSIIIPTLNEEEGIAKTICSIPEKIRKESEILVVDISTDKTPIIAKRLGVRVIKSKKRGKGWQMRYAVKKSKGDVLVFMDGDGTDPGEYIPKLLKKLKNAELVLGCRSTEKMEKDYSMMRGFFKLYSISFPLLFSMFNFKVSDPLAGFRAIRRKDWNKLDLKSDAFEIETEMDIKAMKKGFRIKEVRIPNLKRCGGISKSKFASNPKMWFRISALLLEYNKDQMIKNKK
ncbi:MAG: glycosyltransferase family 2 protein [Gemmatimonadaceae bacterium]|nr:glycosyltransferase family 2 protein [Gemmatimonadaceae bacterium]